MAHSETGKTINADALKEDARRYPVDDHGKLRMQYFKVTALTAALSANDTIALFWLPPGRKRILPNLSRVSHSAFGAGRSLDIGHDAYMKRPAGNDAEAIDVDAFIDGKDVATAANAAVFSTELKFDMYSLNEVLVYATVLGGTMPVGATLEGYMAYLYE
jgi:hypothetical protein